MKSLFFLVLLSFLSLFAQEPTFYYESGKKVHLDLLTNTLRATKKVDYYENEKGIVLGVSDKMLVKMVTTKNLAMLVKSLHLHLIKKFSSRLFLFQTPSKEQTLAIANSLYQRDDVVFAHPDFIKKHFKR
jgi:hypothetical protein